MGASNSIIVTELGENKYLQQLSGNETISQNDPFWNQLLSFSFNPPKSRADHKQLEDSCEALLKKFSQQNPRSGNFRTLVNVFLSRSAELKASSESNDNIFTWQTYNALFIIRCLTKYLVENMSEESVIRQFNICREGPNQTSVITSVEGDFGSNCVLEDFMNAMIEILVQLPVISFNYIIHVEAINCLLILLSANIFMQKSAVHSVIFKHIMQGKCAASSWHLMQRLMEHYVEGPESPHYLEPPQPGGSIVLGLASGIWGMLRGGPKEDPAKDGAPAEGSRSVLGRQSLLLMLVLANHWTFDRGASNPYRAALFHFRDAKQETSSPTQKTSTSSTTSGEGQMFAVSYAALYQRQCSTVAADEAATLLLYFLVHQNRRYRDYVLARADIEALIIPVMKILYTAKARNSHHIYMALIVLLMLSEDDLFNKTVHQVMLRNVTWYTERHIGEVTVGGLLVLVVIRTIQFNMSRMRDRYLHTNCLAALANMSGHFHCLHPYVAQRIVSLFELLCKKHAKIIEAMRSSPEESGSSTETGSDDTPDSTSDQVYDLSVLEEVIRMVLEVMNSCLTSKLRDNPNLVYTMLYRRDLFDMFRSHPTFQDILYNIELVLTHFSSKLQAEQEQRHGETLSPEQVVDVIKRASNQWPKDRLRKFPELKFKYVEEEQPEEFFVPYVWSLVHECSSLHWKDTHQHLFAISTL